MPSVSIIRTEGIGCLRRPPAPIAAMERTAFEDPALESFYAEAVRDTIKQFECAGFLVHVSRPVDPSELVPSVAGVASCVGDRS